MGPNEFSLRPVPPYRLDLTVWTLRRRADNAVDRWDGSTYRRVLPTPDGPMEVAVVQKGSADSPRLHVSTSGPPLNDQTRRAVTAALERLIGLRIDLSEFHRFAASDKRLGPLVSRFRGMKPPRFATLFEGALNSIACQQVTLTLGIRLLNRLAERYGPKVQTEEGIAHAFPRPEDIAGTTPEELRGFGFSRNKGRAMIKLAKLGPEESEELARLEDMPDDEAIARLCELRGIGRWSAEYILLRYLGRTHLFPGDDVGARNNLVDWLGLPEKLDYDGVRQVVTPWSNFGGLLYFHLLLSRLAEAGLLDVEPAPPLGARNDAPTPTKTSKSKAALRISNAKEAKKMAKQPKKNAKNKPKASGAPKATTTPKPPKPEPSVAEPDIVHESGLESFPASDPPSWTPLSTGPPRRD